jgi:hypothetical protein
MYGTTGAAPARCPLLRRCPLHAAVTGTSHRLGPCRAMRQASATSAPSDVAALKPYPEWINATAPLGAGYAAGLAVDGSQTTQYISNGVGPGSESQGRTFSGHTCSHVWGHGRMCGVQWAWASKSAQLERIARIMPWPARCADTHAAVPIVASAHRRLLASGPQRNRHAAG